MSLVVLLAAMGGAFSLWAQSPLLDSYVPPKDRSLGDVSVVRVPRHASAETIQAAIDQAISQSSAENTVRIEFAAYSYYRIGNDESGAVLTIEKHNGRGPQNIVFDGNGCTFVVSSWSRFMKIVRARDLILRDFRITYDPKNITQGTITESLDPEWGFYEVEMDEGFPLPLGYRYDSSDLRWMMVMRPLEDGTWALKSGCPSTIYWKSEKFPVQTGDRTVKIKLGAGVDHGRLHGSHKNNPLLKSAVEVGDKVAILSRTNGKSTFSAIESQNLVYRDIEINHSPAAAFGDLYGERNAYVGITVRPEKGNLFTTTADGIFVTNQRNGPWIEDCYLRGIGDDAVVLKNDVGTFKGTSGDSKLPYIVGGHGKTWWSILAGDNLAIYDMSRRELVSQHQVLATSSDRPMGDKHVALDPPLKITPGNENLWIYNLSNQCNGFVLKDNTFVDHRRWGVLCSAADGSILSNRFVRSQNAAVYLVNSDNYSDNKTGAAPRNIEIKDNQFIESWIADNAHPFGVVAARMNGAIDLTRTEKLGEGLGNDWNGIENITIQNNTFRNWRPRARFPKHNLSELLVEHPIHGIYLRDVTNVKLIGNQFVPSGDIDSENFAIKIDDAKKVKIDENLFHQWPGGDQQAVSVLSVE